MAESSTTKQALAGAMKALLAERPFRKVSVGDICEVCGMSRKSFYYHFKDKYDLLNWIFQTEFVSRMQPVDSHNGWQLLHELCNYFYENRAFYRRAFEVRGQNSFFSYFWEFMNTILTGEMKRIFSQDSNIAFYTAFYVDAFGCAVWNWLRQKNPMPADQFCTLLQNCIMGVSATARRRLEPEPEKGDADR